jgi:hypothetical protein
VSKKSAIVLPGEAGTGTLSLFNEDEKFTKWFPEVVRGEAAFWEVVERGIKEGYLGLDFEFPPSYKASVIGVASKGFACAITATESIVRKVVEETRRRGTKLVGHSVIGAEKKVVEVTTGIVQELVEYDDTMLRHYLLNADLCKGPDKGEDDEAGALGFMGLWTAASLYLLWPAWKDCRGTDCEQVICPRHDVLGYCAIDAAASLEINYRQRDDMARWDVPEKLYNELKELTYIAQQMQDQGVKVNIPYVNEMEKKAGTYKAELFPPNSEFNPRAPEQVVKWFRENGLEIGGNDKKSIRKALEKTATKYGYQTYGPDGKFTLDEIESADKLPKELDALYRLYEFKGAGKGLDSWFGNKYLDSNNFIHPRFITIGASTSRWSSSRPNFTNIPARGFGSLAKGAIIPRDESLDLVHADSSNLELRVCVYLSGFDPSEILPKDPFIWLVNNSNGAFDTIAAINNDTPRGVAKTVSHANSYLEGIKILYAKDFQKPYIKQQIEAGVLRVYRDWEYRGGVVAFTGANLAERIFGDKSWSNRKKALAITEDVYFKQLPMLRDWHRKVLAEIQDKRYVQYPTGHFLRLYGSPEDDAKMGCAALGQGVGAHYVQGLVLRFSRETGRIPLLFIHDSLDFEIPRTWSDDEAREFISLMGEETDRLPGFKCPYKAARGETGLEKTMRSL